MTKVTAIVLAAPVLLAWHWLPGGLPRRLAAGALGALLPLVLWLAWSLPTYGGPFPWSGSRLRLFPSAPTTTAQAWFHLGNHLVNGLWLPYEWDPAHQWLNLTVVVTAGATIVFLAALVVGTISAFLDRLTVEGRGASLAVVTIGAFLVGYAVFELSRRRSIYGSDPRELYAFVGALGILLAALVRRLGDLAGGILCALAIGAWLAVDVGLYLFGSCPRCP